MASSPRIEELKKKFDENPRRYFAPLANEFRKTGDFDQAILICQEFLPQQPGHMSGHIVFGQALFEAGRFEEARTVFETALTLDPENLIALKHLGDISRAGGDIEGARSWYRRVLDADPRNEEIASLLAALDEPATVAWSSPTPKSMPVVPIEPGRAPAPQHAPVPEARVESSVERTAAPEAPTIDFDAMLSAAAQPRTGEPVPPPAPHPTAPESDLLELEDTELTFGGSTPPPADDLGVERSSDGPVDFEALSSSSTDASSFPALEGLESTSFTPPESARAPAPEPSIDVGMSHVAPDDTAAASHVETPFDTFDLAPSTSASVHQTHQPVVPDESREARAQEPSSTVPAQEEAPTLGARQSSSGFVTETMAELYVQQGHLADAVGVYRQLVARYPGDEVLRARLAELESTLEQAPEATIADEAEASLVVPSASAAPATSNEDTSVEASIADAPAFAGDTPTMRDFLGAIASARPSRVAGNEPGDTVEEPAASNQELPFIVDTQQAAEFAAEEQSYEARSYEELSYADAADADAAGDEPETLGSVADELEALGSVADEPSTSAETMDVADADELSLDETSDEDRETSSVGGSIDALFSGAETNSADEEAASRLADAFAPDDEDEDEPPIAGQPARRAQDELSLDHVFRERSTTADRGQPAFSFDQFFSQNASERAGPAPADQASTPSASPDDDIQQFNAWLEGLKKT